jgi:hypothetical protein
MELARINLIDHGNAVARVVKTNKEHYVVVEVPDNSISEENEPYWKKFKMGDVVVTSGLMALFGTYMSEDKHNFESIVNKSIIDQPVSGWFSKYFTIATDDQKAGFFRWLREEKGLEWDGEKLVKTKSNVPKAGDLCIIFNRDYSHAFIAKYVWFLDSCYDNIIKWDGTKEQFEKVLRGELK